jgi:hypothetical protein
VEKLTFHPASELLMFSLACNAVSGNAPERKDL